MADKPFPRRAGEESAEPVRLLVVDDSEIDRLVVAGLVGQGLGWEVAQAEDGARALEAVARRPPDVVLTDLHMPGLDGLELVRTLRHEHPLVPVILMTAFGNEEVAIQALHEGAATYVPKRLLERDLVQTLEGVLVVARAGRRRQRLLGCVTRSETEFILPNDRLLLGSLRALLQETLAGVGLVDGTDHFRVGIALEEALVNAMDHGNLELSSELRQNDDGSYARLATARAGQPPYRDRRIHVTVRFSPAEAVYVIRDEGPGFDPAGLPDPTDPANLEKASGRGLMLIRTFMDEVTHNPTGNQITLVKRRQRPAGPASPAPTP
jgi:CheY-like chemotaxis protein/anti-sigma regulatory factor (Ser/Thr protein kinase)